MQFLIFLMVIFFQAVFGCPPPEKLRPFCVCRDDKYVICSGMDHEQQLIKLASALRNAEIWSLTIEDSSFDYIPHDLFKGITMHELVLRHTSLRALSDTDTAFEGLEADLIILRLHDFDYFGEWSWSELRNMKRLCFLYFEHTNLIDIGPEFKKLSHFNLVNATFTDTGTVSIIDDAFASFDRLTFLNMSRNSISEVKRSMFADPATLLMVMDFSYNRISSLPDDMFTNMRLLYRVYFQHNNILTMSEKTFTPLWNKRLRYLYMEGNHIRCDCRIKWIKSMRQIDELDVYCAEPPALKGKLLGSVSADQLWC